MGEHVSMRWPDGLRKRVKLRAVEGETSVSAFVVAAVEAALASGVAAVARGDGSARTPARPSSPAPAPVERAGNVCPRCGNGGLRRSDGYWCVAGHRWQADG